MPQIYDRYMVPLLFRPYAEDMAAQVAAFQPSEVLEIAAGSGAVTRALAPLLDARARYVVSDLNAPMLEQARAAQPPDPRIEWAVADAMDMPFASARFDVVCCQFGAMFLPDKARGYAEVRRVLKPGAPFIFNVWDRLADNEITATVLAEVQAQFPQDPPDFLARVPHGYADADRIRADLRAGGFARIEIGAVSHDSVAPSAREAAVALCMGSPMRMEIVARDPDGLARITDLAEAALRRRHGDGPVSGRIKALVAVAWA